MVGMEPTIPKAAMSVRTGATELQVETLIQYVSLPMMAVASACESLDETRRRAVASVILAAEQAQVRVLTLLGVEVARAFTPFLPDNLDGIQLENHMGAVIQTGSSFCLLPLPHPAWAAGPDDVRFLQQTMIMAGQLRCGQLREMAAYN